MLYFSMHCVYEQGKIDLINIGQFFNIATVNKTHCVWKEITRAGKRKASLVNEISAEETKYYLHLAILAKQESPMSTVQNSTNKF